MIIKASKPVLESLPEIKSLKVHLKDKTKLKNLLSTKVVKALTELTYNLLEKNFQVSTRLVQKLAAFKGQLIFLCSKGNLKGKAKVWSSKKGCKLLSILIPTFIPVIQTLRARDD